MALLLRCKQGSVRVNGEPVTGIVLLPEAAVIEPMAESQFEVLMAQTIAETPIEPPPGVPAIRANFPPSIFLSEVYDPKREVQLCALQTPDGSVRFANRASPVPAALSG
ncbi:MAG: hypothetical protein QHJ82_09285 [Verrucomicrobiota bacterium]|nr:hypothetical protein [Verrucomicrobiota bacterium]